MSGAGEREQRARDAEARRLAQTLFDRPLVLEAGAGTGKTAALVARVIAWCMGEGWERARRRGPGADDPVHAAAEVLRRVVAITFTEAAAAEMAERVAAALLDLERGRCSAWIAPEVLPPEPERGRRARELLRALDHLSVRTIHAFCRRMLAEHPLEAGLHPHFAVDADESQQKAVIREVVEGALPALLANPADLVVLGRARPPRGPAEIEDALLQLLRQGVPAAALAADPFARERVAAFRDRLAGALEAFLGRFGEPLGGLRGKTRETLDGLRDVAERLRGFAGGSQAELAELVAWIDERCERCGERLGAWSRGRDLTKGDEAAVGEALDELRSLAGALRRELAHARALDPELLGAARRLLHPLLARVEAELRARGVATFPSLLRDARDLLARNPSVARRMRRRIDQLLVDEFQDTDRIQCEIIGHLVLDAPREERPGLFVVGDPKQSIYGWRNADLGAYADFLERVEAAGGRLCELAVNYRSVPAILAEVDRLVEPVMIERRGVQPPFRRLLPDPEKGAARGFSEGVCAPVEHWVSWRWEEATQMPVVPRAGEAAALEAAALAADVARLHASHGVAWNRIGVLFRGATDLETYLEALRHAGIPFVVEGDRNYFQRREIIEASALVRCILDPNDQLALVAVLRSALAGVPDAALIPLWSKGFPGLAARLHRAAGGRLDELAAAVVEAAAELPAEIPGIERIGGWEDNLLALLRSLAELRTSFEDDPADLFVEKLRTLLLFEVTEAARYPGVYRVANLDRFFRDLEEAFRDGEGDPQAILRIMRQEVADRREAEEGRPKEAAEDAVQILTMHKAKGLAFDHVYVLQLHKGPGRGDDARAEEFPEGFEYRLFGVPTPGYARVQARRDEVEEAERVRTLYVALTRARERLVIAGSRAEGDEGPSEASQAALLGQRRGGMPELAAAMQELGRSGLAFRDEADARWVFPGLPAFSAGVPAAAPGDGAPLFSPEAVERDARLLHQRRESALRHMARPFRAAVSAAAHEDALDAWREPRAPEDGDDAAPRARTPREVATAVGTAVHRALERFDWNADPDAEWRCRRGELEDELVRALPAGDRRAALERADALLARFAGGALCARLRALREHVVARELPVLLPPSDGDPTGATGFVSGTVDLVYRDPGTGRFVVADYKTDRVESDLDLAERTARYREQGAGYVRAVREALGLDHEPRFELWFLDRDRVG